MAIDHRIVGTAGHIDHGKTTLVRALTGVDTDRLPEEKRRGITIDLGFAQWKEENLQVGFIDVPGHERFVKNMLAGVGGIDAALLVVAADESVKPQTREHFAICRLLRIPTGIVVITKADLVERDILELVRLEVEDLVRGSFLEGRPIVAASAATGEGIDDVKAALRETLASTPDRDAGDRVFRLPIDRAFTMKGFGSVVTGTTISGSIGEGDDLAILPDGKRSRARNIQVHGSPRDRAGAGERTSINLSDVALGDLHRGQQLTAPGTLRPGSVVTAELELLPDAPPLRDQTRVRFHLYSAELLGNVKLLGGGSELAPGGRRFVQVRLESPVVAAHGDRFVIRRYSPAVTIGGGVVLDSHLPKLRAETRDNLLETLRSGSLPERVTLLARLAGRQGITIAELQARTGLTVAALTKSLRTAPPETVVVGDGAQARFLHADVLREVRSAAMATLEEFYKQNRTAIGMPKGEFLQKLKIGRLDPGAIAFLLSDLASERIAKVDGDVVDVPGRSRTLGGAEGELARMIEERFREAGLAPPPVSELIKTIPQRPKTIDGVIAYLVKLGVILRLAENVYLHRDAAAAARQRLEAHRGESVDVGWFKDLFGISRKIVIPLLEYFDKEKVTKRAGDKRTIL
ncbi:MAG TPA: selenocysteine-specific translation elongation factor [Thermoanaerobaculia bacterium]|nr:selenocysteine-specific translation elongation factor [Thermoanaerobaculia bacterium]